jgi:hypothetical protein
VNGTAQKLQTNARGLTLPNGSARLPVVLAGSYPLIEPVLSTLVRCLSNGARLVTKKIFSRSRHGPKNVLMWE